MIRRRHRSALPGCVAAFTLIGSFPPPASADWPQHRGDPAATATAPALSGRLLVPEWTRRFPSVILTGKTHPGSVTASAAIVDGVVYVGSRNTRMYALDAASGATIWEYSAGSEIESSALVRDGAVIFVPYNGSLTALNASDGSVRWQHGTGGLLDRSSPNLSAGNIIGGASYPLRDIYAVPFDSPNPASAAWKFPTGQFIYASPAVDPGTGNIYASSNDGRLYALRPDGSPLWGQPFEMIGGVFRASPAIANGKVYITSGNYDWALHAINAATGQVVWNAAMPPTPALPVIYPRDIQVSSPAVDGDFVSVVGGYGNRLGPSILYAFDDKGTTVETRWTLDLPNSTSEGYVSSPVLTPDDVIIGVAAAEDSQNPTLPRGRVYTVDRATGAPTWYAAGDGDNAGGPIFASPAVSGDLVVVGDASGLLTAYRAVPPGDVDGDGVVTALDALVMMAAASGDGQAAPGVRYRGDLLPAGTIPPDGARSFGDGLITPADADHVLRAAVGIAP